MSSSPVGNGELRLFGPSGRVDPTPQTPAEHFTVADKRILEGLRDIKSSLDVLLDVLEELLDIHRAGPESRPDPGRSP